MRQVSIKKIRNFLKEFCLEAKAENRYSPLFSNDGINKLQAITLKSESSIFENNEKESHVYNKPNFVEEQISYYISDNNEVGFLKLQHNLFKRNKKSIKIHLFSKEEIGLQSSSEIELRKIYLNQKIINNKQNRKKSINSKQAINDLDSANSQYSLNNTCKKSRNLNVNKKNLIELKLKKNDKQKHELLLKQQEYLKSFSNKNLTKNSNFFNTNESIFTPKLNCDLDRLACELKSHFSLRDKSNRVK